MRSLKTLAVVVAILAIFTFVPSTIFAQSAMTPPSGIIKFARYSQIWYGFIPGEIYLVKAEWPNQDKSKWYILAFAVRGGKVGEEPYLQSSPLRLPAISKVYDGTITANGDGSILLHNMSTGKNTPLIELK